MMKFLSMSVGLYQSPPWLARQGMAQIWAHLLP